VESNDGRCGIYCIDGGVLPGGVGFREGLREAVMEYAIALAVAAALAVYLFYALLKPERF
jgi:K+-transporting ATPase KdpF subunit